MKHYLKFSILLIIACTVVFLWIMYGSNNGVIVLEYHRVKADNSIYSISPEAFEQQMHFLTKCGYTSISISQLTDALSGKSRLPSKPILITFDDGYDDNYYNALPILEKYGLRSTIFIITDKVNFTNYLSWDQIKYMQARNVEFESHTKSHRDLTQLRDPDLTTELSQSRTILQDHLNTKVDYISYPYGAFNSLVQQKVKEAGYLGAFSGIVGINNPSQNPFRIRRIPILQTKSVLADFERNLIKETLLAKLYIIESYVPKIGIAKTQIPSSLTNS